MIAMKRMLLSMALLLTLGSTVPVSAQRHRHTPRTESVAQQPGGKDKKAPAGNAFGTKQADEGIEAYSDTS